jgi:hypothetical protein
MAFLPAVIEIRDSNGNRINQPDANGVSQPIVLRIGASLTGSCLQLPSGLTQVTINGVAGSLAPAYTTNASPQPAWAGARPSSVIIASPLTATYYPETTTLQIGSSVDYLRVTGNGVSGSIEPLAVALSDGLHGSYNDLTRLLTLTSIATASSFHSPVHAVTLRNLEAVDGGLAKPNTWQYFSDYDGDSREIDNGTRVGVWSQDDPTENSVYIYDSTGDRLVRSTEVVAVGHMIPVRTGRVWGGSVWLATDAIESSYTYEPQLGAPTHASWTRVTASDIPIPVFEDRWVNLLSIPASAVRRENLDIELIATAVAVDSTQVRYHKFASYNGNPAGAMFPVGDALGNTVNGCLDEPWVDPKVARIRARQSGGNLLIDGLRDAFDDVVHQHWRYSVEATVKIRLVGEEPPS